MADEARPARRPARAPQPPAREAGLLRLRPDLGLLRLFPQWRAMFGRATFRADVVAGASVASVAAPLALASLLAIAASLAAFASRTFSPYRMKRQSPQKIPESRPQQSHEVCVPSVFWRHWWQVAPRTAS